MIRLPPPGPRYDPTQAAAVQSSLEQFLARVAVLGQGAQFADVQVLNLTVGKDLTIVGKTTFGPDWVLPLPTFKINGLVVNTLALPSVISAAATGGGGKAKYWGTPAGGGAGVPQFRNIPMADLPSYVPQDTISFTQTTVANNAGANVALSDNLAIAANSLTVGDMIRFTARGVYGDGIVAPNITLALLGNAVVLATTGANAAAATGLTNRGWEVRVDLMVQAIGALTGRLEAQGYAILSSGATAAQVIDMENTALIVFNTTIVQTLQLCVTWGTAAAANTITCRQTLFERMAA